MKAKFVESVQFTDWLNYLSRNNLHVVKYVWRGDELCALTEEKRREQKDVGAKIQ